MHWPWDLLSRYLDSVAVATECEVAPSIVITGPRGPHWAGRIRWNGGTLLYRRQSMADTLTKLAYQALQQGKSLMGGGP